jgi:DNA-binding transcriptional regulator YhcF (GntR family)
MMLYERLYAIYDFIAQYNHDYGQIPSLKEIAAAAEVNPKTLNKYLDQMELMGMLERMEGKARAIRLIRRDANWNALVNPAVGELPPQPKLP